MYVETILFLYQFSNNLHEFIFIFLFKTINDKNYVLASFFYNFIKTNLEVQGYHFHIENF
jgi:hypothetical protein